MNTSAYQATFFICVAVVQGIPGAQNPNLYVLQNCMNCSKQHPTHPLLVKSTGLMGQLLTMHLASHKCHFVQPEADESITFGQCGGYKHAVFVLKKQLQFSALSVLKDAAIKVTSSFTEEPVCKNLWKKTMQFCIKYDTKQEYECRHLCLYAKERRLHFCYTECSQHFLLGKGGDGSIWQAGSLLLARSFACKMSQFSLFRDDCI